MNSKDIIIIILLLIIFFIIVFYIIDNRRKNKKLMETINFLEEINIGNYKINIETMEEGKLSILRNEVYKTAVRLREVASISEKDKESLKISLEDISHQLKTPLTSILIMLDNLIDDPDMDVEVREDFIRDIKREVTNINFLVQSLLKLSKFDSNTIHFIKEDRFIKDIIDMSIKNVSANCDLKNISIVTNGKEKSKVHCDFMWEVEAITNIIKNCVEHSKENSKIMINYEQNKAYSSICIQDFAGGISKKDLPHIFERFYKGENSNADSVGIGLAISKTIIEKDNGTISVETNNEGTKFTVKYFSL